MVVADRRAHEFVEHACVDDRAEVGQRSRHDRRCDREDETFVEGSVAQLVEQPAAADAEEHGGTEQRQGGAADSNGLAPIEADRGGEHIEHAQVRHVRMSVGGVHVRAEA